MLKESSSIEGSSLGAVVAFLIVSVFCIPYWIFRTFRLSNSTTSTKSVRYTTPRATNDYNMNPNDKAVELLLLETRKSIADENPNEALSSLLEAIRISQGEEAIMGILDAAKKRAAEEIDSDEGMMHAAVKMSMYLQNDDSSLLYQNGRTDILRDAFEDGSSVVCPSCGSLVPRARAEIHSKFWCEASDGAGMDEVDSD
jgi:hypothetical protein